jgi:hypothetical protein
LKRPTLALAVAVNRSVRQHDEWFDEPDDLDRVERAIAAIETMNDPVEAAAVLACRLTRLRASRKGTSGRGCSSAGGS